MHDSFTIKLNIFLFSRHFFLPSKDFHRRDGPALCGKAYTLRKGVLGSFLYIRLPLWPLYDSGCNLTLQKWKHYHVQAPDALWCHATEVLVYLSTVTAVSAAVGKYQQDTGFCFFLDLTFHLAVSGPITLTILVSAAQVLASILTAPSLSLWVPWLSYLSYRSKFQQQICVTGFAALCSKQQAEVSMVSHNTELSSWHVRDALQVSITCI